MPALLFQFISVTTYVLIFFFVLYYIYNFRKKEKEVEKKEEINDRGYNQIIQDALEKERKILEQAMTQGQQILEVTTNQANQLIAGAQFISKNSIETLNQTIQKMEIEMQNIGSNSKITVNQAMQKIAVDLQKEALETSTDFIKNYDEALKQAVTHSLQDFQIISKGLEVNMQKQINDFNQILLTNLVKELDEYKKIRLKEAEQTITVVIQRASQEILGKLITLNDHQNLMIESLEKAKKEGIFNDA